MMKPFEFWEIMQPLAKHCQPMDEDDRNFYFEQLKRYIETDLRQAVSIIRKSWEWKRWPTVKEFEESLNEVANSRSYADLDELEAQTVCDKCHNVGRYVDDQNKEAYCDCIRGRKWRALRKKQGFVVDGERVKPAPMPPRKEKLPYRDAEDGVPF